jgi:hypothetical protein
MTSKRVSFKERLKANILAAKLADALENNEYQGSDGEAASPGEVETPSSPPPVSAVPLADRLTDSPTEQPSLCPSDQLPGSRDIYHTDTLTDTQSNKHTHYFSNSHTQPKSPAFPTTTDPALCMTDTQAQVLAYLVRTRVEVIKYEELSQALDIPYGTVRWAVAKLEKERFLAKRKFRKGRIQGIAVTLSEAACQDFMHKRMGEGERTGSALKQHTDQQATYHTTQLTHQHTLNLADNAPLLKKERKEDSVCLKLRSLSEEDLEFHYPNLARTGFGVEQIRQVLERLAKVDKSPARLFESLEHAEFELGQGPLKDKDGVVVGNPCAFVFTALAKTGYYRRPKGFVAAEELAAQEAEEQLAAVLKARERTAAARFEAWKAGLTPTERAALLANRMGPEEQWLKNHYLRLNKPGESDA